MLKLILLLLLKIYFVENITTQTHENIILNTATSESPKQEDPARKFLYLYSSFNPVILLIDDTQQSHIDAVNFYKNVHRLSPKIQNLNFMVMKFNATGATPLLESTRHNRHRFEEILSQENQKSSSFLGHQNFSTSAVFFGILKAVHQLPVNSGVVVFMKRNIEDADLAEHAKAEVAKKRIQVFVIRSGKNRESLLKNLALLSHGAFLAAPDQNISELNYERFLENLGSFTSASLLFSRKNLQGENKLSFPIDSEVTGLHISITPNITLGILTTPRGYNVDVLNGEEVSQFSVGSFVKQENERHEIHLNTTTTQDVGVWRLHVGNARTLYNITIFAQTKLTTNAIVTVQNQTGQNKVVKLAVTGDVSAINNITFLNEYGQPVLSNVKFKLDKKWENQLTENIDEVNEKELNITVEEVPKESFYAVVTGKDGEGNDFERLSYISNTGQKGFYLPPLTVEVGIGSDLIAQPFQRPTIFFEVTNNGNAPTLVRFFCRDQKGILQFMEPWYKWVNSKETVTVRVTLIPRQGTYQDFITFTAAESETVSKQVIVDVGEVREDRKDPKLNYIFTSDCTSVLAGACEDSTWAVEVRAKDTDSGLLRVLSRPRGLHFPNGFTAGTTEEVTGYYTESCCNPELKLIAYDRQNNRYTRQINAYHANLGPGAIAAIVLGVLLIILLIVLVVIFRKEIFVKCCTTTSTGSYNLPVYRGPLTSRRT